MYDPTAYEAIKNLDRGGYCAFQPRKIRVRTLTEDDMRKMDEKRKPVSFFDWISKQLEEQNDF